MNVTFRQELRREALLELLVTPDLQCLRDRFFRPRGYRQTVPRDPRKDPEILKRNLGIAYVQHRCQDHGQDVSGIVSINAQPKLRLVR